jgi:hypothetical protein
MHLGAEMELNPAIHLKAVIEQVWRFTWSLSSSNSEMNWEAKNKLNSEMY